MSKKHFIALADALRERAPAVAYGTNDQYDRGRIAHHQAIIERLADFCASQSPRT